MQENTTPQVTVTQAPKDSVASPSVSSSKPKFSNAPYRQRKEYKLGIVVLALGLCCFFSGAGLLYFEKDREQKIEKKILRLAIRGTQSFFQDFWTECAYWVNFTTVELQKTSKAEAFAKQSRLVPFYANSQLFFFNKSGELITSNPSMAGVASESAVKDFRTAVEKSEDLRALRSSAVPNQPAKAYARINGNTYFAVAGKVEGSAVDSVLLTIALDSVVLRQVKALTRTDLIVLTSEDLAVLQRKAKQSFTESVMYASLDATVLQEMITPKNSSLQKELPKGKATAAIYVLDNSAGVPIAGLAFVLPGGIGIEIADIPGWLLLLSGVGLLTWWARVFKVKPRVRSEEMGGGGDPRITPSRRAGDIHLHDLQAMQQKNTALLEMHQILQKKLEESSTIAPYYQRFIQNAPIGIFRCTPSGQLQQINEAFALMLGFDSSVHLITERESFVELFQSDANGKEAFHLLQEKPDMRHEALLRMQDGEERPFWFISIAAATEGRDHFVEGFLIDRSCDMQLAHCRSAVGDEKSNTSSLGLLLASCCQFIHTYFVEDIEEDSSLLSDEDLRQRRANYERLRKAFEEQRDSIFMDIYAIGLFTAEEREALSLSVDLPQLLREVADQIAPVLDVKQIRLKCTIAPDVPQDLSVSAPLLRHALVRSLLLATNGRAGGVANIIVQRTSSSSLQSDEQREVTISVSWEDPSSESLQPSVLSDAAEQGKKLDGSLLLYTQERDVMQFLAKKLNGRFVEGLNAGASNSFNLVLGLEEQYADEAVTRQQESLEAAPFSSDPDADLLPEVASAETLLLLEDESDEHASLTNEENGADEGLDILLVDSSVNSRMLFSLYLGDTSHRIREASDGQEGVELFKEKHFDVVFMDMELAQLDGYQATKIIRAFEVDSGRTPVPIIAQTAHMLPEFKGQCLQAGCTYFMAKPFSRHMLLGILNTVRKNNEEDSTREFS